MINRELLKKTITASGLKQTYIADQLHLSPQGFRLKLKGNQEFRESEIQKLCEILHLKKTQRDSIFFARKVEETATLEVEI